MLWDDVQKYAHLQWRNGAAVVRICDVQLRHPENTLGRVRLPDHLQYAGEGSPKLQRLQRRLLVGSVVDTGRDYVWFTGRLRVRRGRRCAWDTAPM